MTHRPISRPIWNGPSTGSVGNNGSSQPASQTRKARTPRSRTGSGDRLEEIDRPLIVPSGIRWEKHPFKSREPSTVQGALVRQYYPEPIGPDDNKKPALTWEDYKWSSNPRVQTAASRIKDEFWWRFKCNPSDQRDADETLELNLAEKVRQMIHEEKKAAMKRLYKRGNVTEEKYEEGNIWPTVVELISTKPDDFGTDDGWRLLCEHWSTQESRNNSLRGKRNRLANGDTIYHCSGARSIVATRQYLKQKTGKDPGLAGAWQHTHRLKRGNERVEMCSQKASDRWETFDNGMKNMHGENWQEEHPEFDGSVIYETTGRMPHGRLRIADEAFTKIDKSIIKATKIRVSQQEQSAREQERLQRENRQLRHENKELRGVAQVVRALIYRGGLDYDTLMEEGAQHESGTYDSEHEYYSDSDLYDELARQRDKVDQTGPELGPGSNAGSGDNHMEGGNINDESEST